MYYLRTRETTFSETMLRACSLKVSTNDCVSTGKRCLPLILFSKTGFDGKVLRVTVAASTKGTSGGDVT